MIEAVQRDLAEVKEEIKQVKSRIKQLDLLPKDDPDRQELVALRQELVELRKKENRLAEGVAGAAGAAAAGTKPSGTLPEAKTVELILQAVLHGEDTFHQVITFNDEDSFQKYLTREQCGGLIQLDEGKTKRVVNSFDQLVPDGIYTHSLSSKEAVARLLGEARHLQQSREEEFGRALTAYLQAAEPEQGYELREDLRMLLIDDNKIAEHDVVVLGKDKACVGSHKTYAKGAKPVKEVAERCEKLAKLPNKLPAVVTPAFMVEHLAHEAEPRIKKACTDMKVVRFQRCGHAIKVMNRMGAAGRLLFL